MKSFFIQQIKSKNTARIKIVVDIQYLKYCINRTEFDDNYIEYFLVPSKISFVLNYTCT